MADALGEIAATADLTLLTMIVYASQPVHELIRAFSTV